MDRLEHRVRVLEEQLVRHRTLNRLAYLAVGLALLGCGAYVVSDLLKLSEHVQRAPLSSDVIRVRRLEIVDEAATRPVCVIRADDGGGRVEVRNRHGASVAGFDGNRALVVRAADSSRFPESRAGR